MRPLSFSLLIAALVSPAVTSFTPFVSAAPGDARMIHGTIEWPATLDREPFIVVRGDDGKLYQVDVTSAQRRGHVGAGARVVVAVVEGQRPYQVAGVTLIPNEDAAAPAPATVVVTAAAESAAAESVPVETARPARPKRAPAAESRPAAPERTPAAEARPTPPKRTPPAEARAGAPERTPTVEARPVAPKSTPGTPTARSAAPKGTPAGDATSAPLPSLAAGPAADPHPTIASSAGSFVNGAAPDVAGTIARALSGIAGDSAVAAVADRVPASAISSSSVRSNAAEPTAAAASPADPSAAVTDRPSTVAAPPSVVPSAVVSSPSAVPASPPATTPSPSSASTSAVAASASTERVDTAAASAVPAAVPARPAPPIAMTSILAQSHWRMEGTVEAVDDMNVVVKTPNGKLWRIDVSTLSWLTRFRWRAGDRITLFGEPRADLRLVANGSLQYEIQSSGTSSR